MGVDKVNGKEVIINEIRRMNGGNIKEEAIDLIFDRLQDESGNVSFDLFTSKLCSIYALDKDDQDFLNYMNQIAGDDRTFSLTDLNNQAYEMTNNASANPNSNTQTTTQTKTETVQETGSQTIARYLGYQGITVTSQRIEELFASKPSDKDFATYLKEQLGGNYDVTKLSNIIGDIGGYNDVEFLQLGDLSHISNYDDKEMTGAQNIAETVNKRLHDESRNISADTVISLYNQYVAQGGNTNEGFAQFILNTYSLSGSHKNFILENIVEAAKSYGSLELNDLQTRRNYTLSYEVVVEVPTTPTTTTPATPTTPTTPAATTPPSTNGGSTTTTTAPTQATQATTPTTPSTNNSYAAMNTPTYNSAISGNLGSQIRLTDGTPTSVLLADGTVFDITNDLIKNATITQDTATTKRYTVSDKGVEVVDRYDNSKIYTRQITAPSGDTVYVNYNRETGTVEGIYLNRRTEEGKLYSTNNTSPTESMIENPTSVDDIIENAIKSAGNPLIDGLEETVGSNGYTTSVQKYDSGYSISTYTSPTGKVCSKIIYDENGKSCVLIDYSFEDRVVVKEYTGEYYNHSENYRKTTQYTDGSMEIEIQDNNAIITTKANGEITIEIDGKTYNVTQGYDGMYKYSPDNNDIYTHYFKKDENGIWTSYNVEGNNEKPEEAPMKAFMLRLDATGQQRAVNKATSIMADGCTKDEVVDLLKEDMDPILKMAVLEYLSDSGYTMQIEQAMDKTDVFLKTGLEKLMANRTDIQTIIDFENRYMQLQSDDGIAAGSEATYKNMAEVYLQLYENAGRSAYQGSDDMILYANHNLLYSIPELAVLIQEKYSNSGETDRLTRLAEAAGYDSSGYMGQVKNGTSPSNASSLRSTYLDSNKPKDNLYDILVAVKKDELKLEDAYWLLTQDSGLDSAEELIKVFRSLSNGNQEKYIESLYNILAYRSNDGKTEQQSAPTRNDSSRGNVSESKANSYMLNAESLLPSTWTIGTNNDKALAAMHDSALTATDRMQLMLYFDQLGYDFNRGFYYGVSETFKDGSWGADIAGYQMIFKDIKSVANQSSNNYENIRYIVEGYQDIMGGSKNLYNFHGVNQIPNYTSAAFEVFHTQQMTTEADVLKYEQLLDITGLTQYLSKCPHYYTQGVNTMYQMISIKERAVGITYDLTDYQISTYIDSSKDKETNIKSILKALKDGKIDDYTAHALIMSLYGNTYTSGSHTSSSGQTHGGGGSRH